MRTRPDLPPLILLTNDDGIHSPGLAAAAEAVFGLGDLLIAAPARQQTTMGRAFPRDGTSGVISAVPVSVCGQVLEGYGITGSPGQAVAHAVLELCSRLPDLCISGINYGENLGQSLTCSGTLGAAFEAYSHGIPGLAVSRQTPLRLQHLDQYPDLDWSAARHITRILAADLLRDGLPPGTCLLNLNVPEGATPATPVRVTRQSRMSSSVFRRPGPRSFGSPLGLQAVPSDHLGEAEADSDIRAFFIDQAISVTPISWDFSANATWPSRWP